MINFSQKMISDKRKKSRNFAAETRDNGQETTDKGQETKDKRQKTRDNGQETRDVPPKDNGRLSIVFSQKNKTNNYGY